MRGFRVSQFIFIGNNSGFGGTFFPFKDLHEANNNRRQMPQAVMFSSTSKNNAKDQQTTSNQFETRCGEKGTLINGWLDDKL